MVVSLPRALIVLCLCAGAVLAQAQTSSESTPMTAGPLSLQQCLTLALANQVDVLVSENNAAASQARSTQARSSYYPQVSVQTNSNLLQSTGINRDRNDAGLTVTQNFYDGGLREARVARAKSDVAQTGASLTRTRQAVTYSVTRAYFDALRARHLAEVADQRVAYIEGQRDLVQARVQAGDAAEVDAWPLEAQLANARVDQLAAKNTVRTATVQLQQAMGLTPVRGFDVQDVTVSKTSPLPAEEECLSQALAQRPEVLQSRASIDSARANVKTARISMGPRPVVTGQLGQPIGSGDSTDYSINAGIVFDLFNGGNTKATYQEAQAGLSSAEARAGQVPKDITAEVQDAYLNAANAQERMDASTVSLAAAQRNFTAQQERYAQGLAIPLDLLNAQLEVTTAQSNAVQAQYDYLTAQAQLRYAMGQEGAVSWE